jgi:predicted Zn-dependent peptidase
MATSTKFKKTVFENGLTLVSERLSEFRSLSLGVWVKKGTRHEAPGATGVSHFLEHMLFKGTQKRSALQIAKEIDQVGGEFNAFTAREHTCFHFLLLDRDYDLGLDILSDILLNSNFKLEELERERKVILQEIAMVEESPEELAYDLYFERIYANHGLGKPILGTHHSVKQIDRRALMRFFRTHYRPDQLVISVAGDVSHETLKKKLRLLSRQKWPGRSEPVNRKEVRHSSVPRVQSGAWWVTRGTEQVHLIWGVEGPRFSSPARFAAFLLNIYLGGGMSSSLFQEIREKNGLAYTVYSSLSPFVDSGVFSIYVGTQLGQVGLCLELVEKCIERIKKKGLSRTELRMIQDNLKGTILLSSDCVESRMSSIAKNEMFLGKYVSIKEVCQQVDAVTQEDVQRMANLLFRDQSRSLFALGPQPNRQLSKIFEVFPS